MGAQVEQERDTNAASGLVTMTGSGDHFISGGDFSNAGTVSIGIGEIVNTGLFNYNQNAGLTTVNTGGTLRATTVNLNGGKIIGGGSLDGNLVVDGGTLSPGDPQNFTVTGNYDQTLLGILDLDFLDELNFDRLIVGGDATLNGTLNLTLEPGFNAAVGSTFLSVVSWGGLLSGNFANFTNFTFHGGTRGFQEIFNTNGRQIDLKVVDLTSNAVPEPSTLLMVFSALLLGAAVTWRTRRGKAGLVK